jgi:hypothetical protein
MAKFEVAGQTYDSDNISESQKQLVSSLSFTKELNKEIELKLSLIVEIKKILEKVWEDEIGSKIVGTLQKKTGSQIKLANGKKLNFSNLSEKAAACSKKLLFINEQISYYNNQLQVLDTAKITYSKGIYQSFTVTE